MRGHKMYQLWAIIFLIFTLNNLSEAKHEKKLPSAVVVGTVYCDTCFQQSFSKASHFISGALVAVECADTRSRTSFRKEVKTNEHGEFEVHLPFAVSKHVKKIKRCSVKLISSSEPYCAVASTATSSSLHLKSRKEGTHIFSAGFFTFKPLKQPELCDQKPSVQNTKAVNADKSLISNPNDPTFPPPIQDPPSSNLPPISQDLPPLPQLPTLPPLPKLPPLPPLPPGFPFLPPVPKTTIKGSEKSSQVSDKKVAQTQTFGPNPFMPPSLFPPNPFLPPPSILPPVIPAPPPSIFPPIFPSPPSSIFPPIFPSPPPSPLINFPPIPGFTPSPPPPPPVFQFPLPPFPFQPVPGFPGVPPATPSLKKHSP